MATDITMKQLLEAGTHFGHQTKRWNPKMKPYIFGAKNGIYIIDLQKTLRLFRNAIKFLENATAEGKTVLFIATKKQAQVFAEEEATRCAMPFITNRWLGGMLTNFETIKKRIARLNELEKMKEGGLFEVLPKKEVIALDRETEKLSKNLSGIKDMTKIPDIVFIIDPKREAIAINEAQKLGLKIVAMVDTNCDPDGIDYVIPANDDAIRSIKLVNSTIADAILEGSAAWGKKKTKEEAEKRAAEEVEAKKKAEAKAEAEKNKAAADPKKPSRPGSPIQKKA